jgi:hypothetical protein
MEAVRREQPIGCLDELLARPGLAIGASQSGWHTASI